ncbi:MAG: hypothetical protein QXH66_00885 [Conexivisphaerales archaeon]
MAADGEEVLMSRKKDMRGSQSRIARLASFYIEGFVHMLFYRILVPISIAYGALVIAWIFYPQLGLTVKAITAVVWVLFAPQIFETVKGLALSRSRGMAFGHINEEFRALYMARYGKGSMYLKAAPYAVIVIWAIGFIAMLAWWWP